jgi:hypothetical protein
MNRWLCFEYGFVPLSDAMDGILFADRHGNTIEDPCERADDNEDTDWGIILLPRLLLS